MEMLPYLTEDHFTQLGVQTIGARLQLKASIDQMKLDTPPLTPIRSNSLRNSGNNNVNNNNNGNNNHHMQSKFMINSVNSTLQMQNLKNSIDSMAEAIKLLTLTQVELLHAYQASAAKLLYDNINNNNVNNHIINSHDNQSSVNGNANNIINNNNINNDSKS